MVDANGTRPLDPSSSAMTFLPYQESVFRTEARFTWNNWGRQTGKSTAFCARRIVRGIKRRRNQIFLSAGERQSRELMMKAKQQIEAMKMVSDVREFSLFDDSSSRAMEISIPGAGIRVIGLPANPTTARGFTGDVLLDEFAMHREDRAIWASVFPSVLRGHGELDVCSTPRGRGNMFYELKINEDFAHSTVTIDDAIAQGLDVDRDALYRAMNDDEMFRQEFLCEFVDEVSAFLTYALIGECEDGSLPRALDVDALKVHTGDVVAGIDIGRKHDLTVIWVFAVVDGKMVSLGMIELRNVRFAEQKEIISDVLACRCMRKCCVDSTGLGMQLAEELQERFGDYTVEACPFTPKFKEQIGGQMRNRFTDRLIAIPSDRVLREDLHSVEKSVTSAGNIRLTARRDEGSHADRFYAGALACHAASEDHGPMSFEMPERNDDSVRNWR